jgi:hypothetical protein
MTATASSTTNFQLLDDDAGLINGRPVRVAVPDGVSGLVTARNGKQPRCETAAAWRSSTPAECLLEPVVQENVPCLLVLASDRRPVRVNGERRARIAGLRQHDQLQLHDGRTFQVALHMRCVIGRAPDSHKDKPCGVCHETVGERAVYLCPSCDSAVHCDQRDPDDVRDCLSLCSECPSCRSPLVRGEYTQDLEI